MEKKQEAKKETLTNNRSDQAGILDQARLRPHSTVQRPCEAKIINTLLKLKSLGKSEKTLVFVSDRLKILARNSDLDSPELVSLYIAEKKCLESYKDSLVKACNYYVRFNGLTCMHMIVNTVKTVLLSFHKEHLSLLKLNP